MGGLYFQYPTYYYIFITLKNAIFFYFLNNIFVTFRTNKCSPFSYLTSSYRVIALWSRFFRFFKRSYLFLYESLKHAQWFIRFVVVWSLLSKFLGIMGAFLRPRKTFLVFWLFVHFWPLLTGSSSFKHPPRYTFEKFSI